MFIICYNWCLIFNFVLSLSLIQNYDSVDDPQAIIALKYMLLCKVMLNQ